MFRLLGGGGMGDMGKPLPASRLAVLPATAHTAVITQPDLLHPFIKPEFGTQRNSDVTFRRTLSRRAMLRGLAGMAIAATGLARAGNAFASAGPVITAFTYHAPQSALDDLKRRLALTRWPERETVKDWSQGVPLAKLRSLVEYWRTG
jgi:Epoxide hydrolase N terminus